MLRALMFFGVGGSWAVVAPPHDGSSECRFFQQTRWRADSEVWFKYAAGTPRRRSESNPLIKEIGSDRPSVGRQARPAQARPKWKKRISHPSASCLSGYRCLTGNRQEHWRNPLSRNNRDFPTCESQYHNPIRENLYSAQKILSDQFFSLLKSRLFFGDFFKSRLWMLKENEMKIPSDFPHAASFKIDRRYIHVTCTVPCKLRAPEDFLKRWYNLLDMSVMCVAYYGLDSWLFSL